MSIFNERWKEKAPFAHADEKGPVIWLHEKFYNKSYLIVLDRLGVKKMNEIGKWIVRHGEVSLLLEQLCYYVCRI